MSRYIDAEEVEKRIDVVIGSEPKAWDKKALKELKMYIVHAVPSADVRENVKGEWLHKKTTDDYHVTGQCSNCHERRRIDNFCPNCGADMRGGTVNEKKWAGHAIDFIYKFYGDGLPTDEDGGGDSQQICDAEDRPAEQGEREDPTQS